MAREQVFVNTGLTLKSHVTLLLVAWRDGTYLCAVVGQVRRVNIHWGPCNHFFLSLMLYWLIFTLSLQVLTISIAWVQCCVLTVKNCFIVWLSLIWQVTCKSQWVVVKIAWINLTYSISLPSLTCFHPAPSNWGTLVGNAVVWKGMQKWIKYGLWEKYCGEHFFTFFGWGADWDIKT